jgi:crossover junction endodeoxyribonuclease RuvC
MRAIGFDPATGATSPCGWAVVDLFVEHDYPDAPRDEIALFRWGVIQPDKRAPLSRRLAQIAREAHGLIARLRPNIVVCEASGGWHTKFGVRAAIAVAQAQAAVLISAASLGALVVELSVQTARKRVAGSGRATKAETMRAVCDLLSVSAPKWPDQADAAVLACAYLIGPKETKR